MPRSGEPAAEVHREGVSTDDMKKHPVLKNRLQGNRWRAASVTNGLANSRWPLVRLELPPEPKPETNPESDPRKGPLQ